MKKEAADALDSFRTLFMEPGGKTCRIRQSENAAFLELLNGALSSIKNSCCEEEGPCPADFVNALAEKTNNAHSMLHRMLQEIRSDQ